ncbi:hypothetical protein M405DRAFT_586593 [Rhizopogon salebrosus TDB-379]|nr:hypothetical protein M405DRAFT_586593 [Rhizopogon salebrosus TDB-379]
MEQESGGGLGCGRSLSVRSAVYASAGVSSLREYLVLAMNTGVVECGGSDGYAWVRLHPDVLSGRHPI